MKKKIWGVLLSVAVLVTTVNFPTTAGAEENKGGADASGIVVKVSDDMNGNDANGSDEIRTVQISAQNQSNTDAVVRVFLLNRDKETADTEVEVPNLCEKDQITDETVQTEMAETLKSALTLESGTNSALDAQWIEKKDDSGNVTAKYLEAALPAGTAAAFDMQMMYRAEEESYEKKTIVRAKAFVDEQDVTEASEDEDEDNEAEVEWEVVKSNEESETEGDESEESEETISKAAKTSSAAEKSAAVPQTAQNYAGETRAVSWPLEIAGGISSDSYITLPVTYYDYLDDNELATSWRNYQQYGNDVAKGWNVFGSLNGFFAYYYKANNVSTPIYFGNLNHLDTGNGTRGKEVLDHINWLRGIYSSYNDTANNSNYFGGAGRLGWSATGIVYNELSDDGNLQIGKGVNAPYFDEEWLTTEQTADWDGTYKKTPGVVADSEFAFRVVNENGVNYYEYNSEKGQDNITLNQQNNGFVYSQGAGNAVKDASLRFNSADTDTYGFFPFNKASDNPNGGDNTIDYGFGAKFEIPFNLNKGGTSQGSSGQTADTVFEFTGDDDVWVFVDGKLVLDLGGAHKMASGSINFKTGQVTNSGTVSVNGDSSYNQVDLFDALGVDSAQDYDPTVRHTLTIFYMERGMIESNLKIRFNMQPITHEFIAEKQVNTTSVNDGLKDAVASADEFNIDLDVNSQPASGKTYQKNDGSTGGTTGGYTTDENGGFTLRDRDQAVFKKQFDENIEQTFTAQESTVQNGKSNLTYDAAWYVTDLENGKVFAQDSGPDAEFVYNRQSGDMFTPVRNKLTYVNTPQTRTLSVTKETVNKENAAYEDDHTEFSFQIMLDMGISTEGHYETPDVTDQDAIYFRAPDGWSTVYAYCYNLPSGSNGEWPGEQMSLVTTDSGVYKLNGVIGRYDYVTISNGNNQQYPGQNIDFAINGYNYFYVSSNSLARGTYTEKGQPQWVPGQKLGYTAYGLTYTVNGQTRTATNGSFTLKSGETAVFEGIPVGTKFKIRETSAEGYTLKGMTINGQAATQDADKYYAGEVASADTEAAVTVTNQKEDTAVNIVAWKTIDNEGGTVPADGFTFILEGQQSKEIDGVMSADTSGFRLEEKNASGGKISFDTLTYTEEGIYCYTLKEKIPEDDERYIYDRTEYEVRVFVTADGNQMQAATTVTKTKDKNGNSATETVEDIATGIKFDNTTNLAALSIQKWLVKEDGTKLEKSSWPDSNVSFSFRLDMKNENGQWVPCQNQPYLSYEGAEGISGSTNSAGIFSIQAQETDSPARIEFQDLVIGKEYRVTELLNDKPQYEFHSLSVDGSEQHPVPAVGVREYSTDAIQIKKGGNQVLYKNYPLNSIKIIKKDEAGNLLQGAEFTLEKWDEASGSWVQSGDPAISDQNGIARFENLHAGKYRITEVKTLPGYVLLKEPIEIELPYEYKAGSIVNDSPVDSDGTAYNITFTVINGQAFDLPQSGRTGIGPMAAVGMAAVVMAGTAFAARNMKGQKALSRRRRRRPR